MREVWRQAHLKQPLGSRDGSRTRQRGGSGLKSTTGGSRGGSSAMARAGGVLHQRVNKRPHRLQLESAGDRPRNVYTKIEIEKAVIGKKSGKRAIASYKSYRKERAERRTGDNQGSSCNLT